MIIKRKMFGLFDLFLPKFNMDPITIKEVQDLDRKYQGFIFDAYVNPKTKKLNYQENINYWKRDNWKTFKDNNKVKILGIREISDVKAPGIGDRYFYAYFDKPTVLLKPPSPDYFTVEKFMEKERSKNMIPDVKFLGKKISFDDGSNFFSQFNTQKLERRVKIDDFYDAILRYEGDRPTIEPPLTKFNIKSRLDFYVVWDNSRKCLDITFLDKKGSDFFWTFNFFSPDDEVEVSYSGD